MLKYSRQREAVKACLLNRKDHPTADLVYEEVRRKYPQISLGTVYRNLSLLVELGEAVKIACNDGVDHFDGCTAPHLHFHCEACNALLDMELKEEVIEPLKQAASDVFDGEVQNCSVLFHGLCPACRQRKEVI